MTVKILLTALVLAACTFLSLAMLNRLENPSSEFANYQEMADSGLIQAGWIPRGIPKSAVDITETHNLDTNIVRISFTFEPGDISAAEKSCQPAASKIAGHVFKCADGLLTLGADGLGAFSNAPE